MTYGPTGQRPNSTPLRRMGRTGARAKTGSEMRLPVEILLDVIGGKWKVRVLDRLSGGPIRFGELRASLPGITQKVLAEQLRQLQRDGLVERTMYPEVPPRVEYNLTPLGENLQAPLASLDQWTQDHLIGTGEAGPTPADDAGSAEGAATVASEKSA